MQQDGAQPAAPQHAPLCWFVAPHAVQDDIGPAVWLLLECQEQHVRLLMVFVLQCSCVVPWQSHAHYQQHKVHPSTAKAAGFKSGNQATT